MAGVLDVAHQRTDPDGNSELVGGDASHGFDESLTETDGPARQIPHSPTRIDIAQREQDSTLLGGDQNLDRQARDLAENPVKLVLGERLADRFTVTAVGGAAP